MLPFRADALALKGKALLRQGRRLEAWEVLGEARAAAEALGSHRSLWPVLLLLSELEAQRGDETSAQELRRQARELIMVIAVRAGSPELRASFLNSAEVRAAAMAP